MADDLMQMLLAAQLFGQGGTIGGLPTALKKDGDKNLVMDTNYMQDIMQMLGDPMLMALGIGGYDPAAFQQVEGDKPDEYELPTDTLAPYLALSAESPEGIIARGIDQGASPSEVVGALGLEADDPQLATFSKLATDLFTQRSSYNQQLSTIPGLTRGEDGAISVDPASGARMVGNKVVVPQMEDSEASKFYTDLGLPTPDETFEAQDWASSLLADNDQVAADAQSRYEPMRAQVEALSAERNRAANPSQPIGDVLAGILGEAPEIQTRGVQPSAAQDFVAGQEQRAPQLSAEDAALPSYEDLIASQQAAYRMEPQVGQYPTWGSGNKATAGGLFEAPEARNVQPRGDHVANGEAYVNMMQALSGEGNRRSTLNNYASRLREGQPERQAARNEAGLAKIFADGQRQMGQRRADAATARGETPLRRALMERARTLGIFG